jgi:hypothetical protein
MKVFDLQCTGGHNFEGWFDDLEDLENQIAQGMLSCPVCGVDSIRRIPSSFAIKGKRPELNQEAAGKLLGRAFMNYLENNFEDVGPQFAQEALKIHYGASEARDIRGVSTPEEEKMLQKEGVNFFKFNTGPPKPKTQISGGTKDEDED